MASDGLEEWERGSERRERHVARLADQCVKAYLRALAPGRTTRHNVGEHLLTILIRTASRLLGVSRLPDEVLSDLEDLGLEYISRAFGLATHTVNANRTLHPLVLDALTSIADRAGAAAIRRSAQSPLRLSEVVLEAYRGAVDVAVTHQVNAHIYLRPLLERLWQQILREERGGSHRLWHALQKRVRARAALVVEQYSRASKFVLTHGQNIERFLRPLVEDYVMWLQAEGDMYLRECEERRADDGASDDLSAQSHAALVRLIDPSLRDVLRSQEYVSLQHFELLLKRLAQPLSRLPLPPPPAANQPEEQAAQATKDLLRERVAVGGEELDGALVPIALETLLRGLVQDDAERAAVVDRVIQAASRTTSGGDSFFVVNDLFGDPSVIVTPADVRAAVPIRIDLEVEALRFRVRTVNCYSLFQREAVEECIESTLPLVTLETEMTSYEPLSPTLLAEEGGRTLAISLAQQAHE